MSKQARPNQSHLLVLAVLIGLLAALPLGTRAAPAAQSGPCSVTYTVNQWAGGFTAEVAITNHGAALTSWTLTWSFGGSQQISSMWNASYTQSGASVTARSMSYNGSLPTGGAQSFGFQASVSGTNAAPTNFALNGAACTGGTSPTATPASATATRTPTPGSNPTATRTPTRTATPVPTTPSGSWPTATGQQAVESTINVSGTYDGSMKRYYGSGPLGSGGQDENQKPLFKLANGAVLKNVILGNPASDGVHCDGSCTLQNVWWEDVGEDAATFRSSSSSLAYLVDGGGAKLASDKIFQHNGAGTLTIRNFQAQSFSTFYRSCGNCSTQYRRNVVLQNVTLTAPGNRVVGINSNYGDTARFSNITIVNKPSMVVCQKYIGNNTGAEPTQSGTGPDSTNCLYTAADITYR